MKPNHISLYFLAFLFLALFLKPQSSVAHGGEKHPKKAKVAPVDSARLEPKPDGDTVVLKDMTPAEHAGHVADPGKVHASLAEFPHIHPLIVHFPIMLLMIAAAMQFVNILFGNKQLNWAVTILVLVGFVTAYAATHWSHPHTDGLTAHAELVLKEHDKYADYTIYLSGLGLLAQLLSVLALKGKRWSIAVAAVILIGAGYAVSMAGHYGAQLVHIEGVGPQGKYLEQHH
ncbi:DUF2231 domain-containing protein [Rufibacter latericius]|uniref:DUF2231 domain-containing protein n=1 Tax=Rufibacter latericius TaxID=2487040 RepID=A0A3M9MGR8_9BACT|nr:hypothetical protein [Rufibacter latericius]RNI24073.1 hypothetical protein EFB08_17005 [Rufibacter latericius]